MQFNLIMECEHEHTIRIFTVIQIKNDVGILMANGKHIHKSQQSNCYSWLAKRLLIFAYTHESVGESLFQAHFTSSDLNFVRIFLFFSFHDINQWWRNYVFIFRTSLRKYWIDIFKCIHIIVLIKYIDLREALF